MADKRNKGTPSEHQGNVTRASGDAGQESVQKQMDEEQEKGYRGTVSDPTPNEHYTVEGVTSGQPTPETDDDAFAAAQQSVRTDSGRRAEKEREGRK